MQPKSSISGEGVEARRRQWLEQRVTLTASGLGHPAQLQALLPPEPGAGHVTSAVGTQTPTPQGMGTPWGAFRVCRRDVLFVVGEAHAIRISHSFLNSSPLCSSNQTKSPDSSKNFTSEKGALPETMNPCRDFTFAIDFMREMLSDSDNI